MIIHLLFAMSNAIRIYNTRAISGPVPRIGTELFLAPNLQNPVYGGPIVEVNLLYPAGRTNSRIS